MSKLAIRGGKPVTRDLLGGHQLAQRRDLERKYLLETHDRGIWDDGPGTPSMAAKFERARLLTDAVAKIYENRCELRNR